MASAVLTGRITWKREKLTKEYQWIPKIIIDINYDQQQTEHAEIIRIPTVRIEKQRISVLPQSLSSSFNEYEFPLDTEWEFPRNQLTLTDQTLGEGEFGRVVMAEACGLHVGSDEQSSIVAVKMLKKGHTDADVMNLVLEMEVMKMIGKHENIINLLGCCSQGGPLYGMVEYAPHGNLREFLNKHRPTSEFEPSGRKVVLHPELISMASQVARGMEHLASRKVRVFYTNCAHTYFKIVYS